MRMILDVIYKLYGKVGKALRFFENKSDRAKALRLQPAVPGLTLYQFQISYFSAKTRNAIYRIGINIPFVDVLIDQAAFNELIKFGGKDQVPCLRIENADGIVWMYESDKIIEYLKRVKDEH